MLLLFCIYGALGKKAFCRILNTVIGLLDELQAQMSRDCRFLLFLHHNYQVSLSGYTFITIFFWSNHQSRNQLTVALWVIKLFTSYHFSDVRVSGDI